jgi:exosortase D (VPLPA-CTERM-specific)
MSSVRVLTGMNPWGLWGVLAVVMTVLGYLYADSPRFLLQTWLEDDNYSHGPFIPLISLYLIWLRRSQLRTIERHGSWWGVPIVAAGLLVYVVGEFAAMYAVVHFSLWIVIVGLLACAIGLSGIRLLAFPLLYLLAALPLPVFLQNELSSRLQLWSSALGIGCLQLVGVMAYRKATSSIWDRFSYKSSKHAAAGICSRSRLTRFALISTANSLEADIAVLSSIPISILLNGFRIGAIGLLVEAYGGSAAEGFSHFFEGWAFVASLGLLCADVVPARVGSSVMRRPFAQLIGPPGRRLSVDVHGSPSAAARVSPASVLTGGVLLILAAFAAPSVARMISSCAPVVARLSFAAWGGAPLPSWSGSTDALQLDDYVLADYSAVEKVPGNVYVAYYQSPKKGLSSHSPRQCIPGGGWEITSFDTVRLDHVSGIAPALDVNRVAIQKGGQKQIVYYWFKQRDRLITSEYLVKFFLFWDSLTRHRADGALVRLVSSVYAGETEAIADGRLQTMVGLVMPVLGRYVPD